MKINKLSFIATMLLSTMAHAEDEDGFYTCIPCPAGTYLSNNECKLCPRGTFSRGGSTSCDGCPPGQYSEYTGDMDNKHCKQCPAGYACPGGTDKQACTGLSWAPAGSSSCRELTKLRFRSGMVLEPGVEYTQHEGGNNPDGGVSCYWNGNACSRDCYIHDITRFVVVSKSDSCKNTNSEPEPTSNASCAVGAISTTSGSPEYFFRRHNTDENLICGWGKRTNYFQWTGAVDHADGGYYFQIRSDDNYSWIVLKLYR